MGKESGTKLFYFKYNTCLIISLLVAILTGVIILAAVISCKTCDDLTVNLEPKVFCASETEADFDIDTDQFIVAIPPNAAITKIYVSVRRPPADMTINNATILISENVTVNTLFVLNFNIDENDMVGSYETTLLHPLCIGPNGANIRVISLSDNTPVISDFIAITVVYCADYCIE
ncbi:MAG: hypothetical protein GX144_00580 [Clostridiaceae bacterium]|jgi:hypothetical protein|nr:hypothetical protein [Clostridiaceae bacterium]